MYETEPKVVDGKLILTMIRWLKKQREEELDVRECEKIDCKINALRWVIWEMSDAELMERSY